MCVCVSSSHLICTSHRIYPSSLCGACLNFSSEKDSAVPFFVVEFCVLTIFHLLGIFYYYFLKLFFCKEKS